MSEPEQARLDLGPIEPGSYDGVQQADDNTGEDWRTAVDALMFEFAARGVEFTPDELRTDAESRGLTAAHSNQWGPRFAAAHRAGLIEPVRAIRSTRKSVRGSLVRAWRGTSASAGTGTEAAA